FLAPGRHRAALDKSSTWHFTPAGKAGDRVEPGTVLGSVREGAIEHPILMHQASGTLAQISDGDWNLGDPVGHLEDGTPIHGTTQWPVRLPRPYRHKKPPSTPLVTGQRCIDFLYPIAEGGTAIIPGGFGTGKTILEQTIAKFAAADIVVYVGCGERGNEMAEMIDEFRGLEDPWSGHELMARTAAVVNTSNMPVVAREAS
ncbi:MAG: V-type ATP synthase subunit A, partial [Desulfuromonadales bacterium]|nr:V-type ATP synthase subunit A [Desulfuromonadales bacterium]NIS40492.1 V-type ATP synthase subunit A [Desulfuromonadales bacterium]